MTPGANETSAGAPILITGGAGFIGSNLADRLASLGENIIVYDALRRAGVEENLAWLRARHPHRVTAVIADVREGALLEEAAGRASAVFHLAAQVAVTSSLENPLCDFETNVVATVRLIDAIRRAGRRSPLIFASTNKVYGDLADIDFELDGETWQPTDPLIRRRGIDENRPLEFHTPYGCSKGAADQYVLDYARSFDVPTCVLRMSCIYGPRQMGTEDQGWVAHFLIRALQRKPITIFGDGCQVRDILHVSDAVNAYLAAWRRIERVKGQAFNLGGGPANAVSLRQLLRHIEGLVGHPLELAFSDWRAGDQRYYVADTRRAAASLEWPPPMHWHDGIADLAGWLTLERGLGRAAGPTAIRRVGKTPLTESDGGEMAAAL
jgi:CDP-paratose 2-epimerase